MIKVAASILALSLWPLHGAIAAPMLGLICAPRSSGSEIVPDPIETIAVTYNEGEWTVVHSAASGKFYVRSEQYDIQDTSGQSSTWSWTGFHKRKKNIVMVSAAYKTNDGFVYVETVSDSITKRPLAEVNATCIWRSSLKATLESPHQPTVPQQAIVRQRPVGKRANIGADSDRPAEKPTQNAAAFSISGGTPHVTVLINDRLSLDFIIDSGASDVSIPSDVALTLVRTGTIEQSDFLGKGDYSLADGSTTSTSLVNIRSLTVGGVTVRNVTASVASAAGPLLLGQSFLTRLPWWTVNNEAQTLEFAAPMDGGDAITGFQHTSSQPQKERSETE